MQSFFSCNTGVVMFAYTVGHSEYSSASRKQGTTPLFGRDTFDPWCSPSTDSIVTLGSVYSTATPSEVYDLKASPTSTIAHDTRHKAAFKPSDPFADSNQFAFDPKKFEAFVFGESNSTLDLSLSFPGGNDKISQGEEGLDYSIARYSRLESDRSSVRSKARGITRSMSRRFSLGSVMHKLRANKTLKDNVRTDDNQRIRRIIE